MTYDRARQLLATINGVTVADGGPPLTVHIEPAQYASVAAFVKETIGCEFFSFLSAVDWKADGLEVVTWVDNLNDKISLVMRSKLGVENPSIPSLVPVYRGANWMERECFDMFGIRFEGHPDLRRILLPDDWEGHPLLKSYAVDTPHPPYRYRLSAHMTELRELDYTGSERLTMNMGPQHPSAHGVFRAILTLEGERVIAVDAVIGYLHRCHEKLAETLAYVQYPSIASKTDYVAAMTSELAYVMAAEQIGKFEVPKRAQYLRVLMAELQRIASHLLWLGTWCMDMGGALGGGATIFLYCIRERELVLDLFESLVGARLLYGFHQVGGVRYDVPAGYEKNVRETIDLIEQRIGEYEQMLEDNAFFNMRTKGVGVISAELAQDVGIAGPLLRGSGVNFDLRKAAPYSSYEDFDFAVPVDPVGDCQARYRVRMIEFRESIKIVRQILDGLPEGPISSRPGVKSLAQVKVPKGEAYARVEGPRGEVGCYLIADGSNKPYRMKWRGASFSNLAVLPHILPGVSVADVVAIMGSVDPVFGEVDR